ncbi:hypothetical protein AB0L41_12185 [Amycolatopsis mediterranei]|uniref:hypothetical protein n=1 Tax=Amycolatopsis mediterranei TaxID=33910 RepID=UPI00343B6043
MVRSDPADEPINCVPLQLSSLSMRDVLAKEGDQVDDFVERMVARTLESGRTMGGSSGEDAYDYTSSRPHRTRESHTSSRSHQTRDSITVTKVTIDAIENAKKSVDAAEQADQQVADGTTDESAS